MILRSKETRVRVIAGVFIYPTVNTIPEGQAKALEEHPDFKQALDSGKMEILEVESVDEDSENIENVVELVKAANVDDAKDLISEILDISQLKEIAEKDRRKSIQRAATAQLDKLTKGEGGTDKEE